MGDYDALSASINGNTRLLISESPTNPHLSVVDLEKFAEIGRRSGVTTMIDATLATPHNLQPLAAGVDLVLHSGTKYLGGHNDLLAGVIVGSKQLIEPIHKLRGVMGPVIGPHACYLLQRGLKTFELRMERQNQNGQAVAEFLAAHPRVNRVYYPGLATHPYFEIAAKTMRGFGGLVTFELSDTDWQSTANVVDGTTLFRIGPSLGGVESLIEQPYLMSYFNASAEDRRSWGISDNMIRISCGIENTDDLIGDLRQALERSAC